MRWSGRCRGFLWDNKNSKMLMKAVVGGSSTQKRY
jgi:hypothetical protein